MTGLNGPSSACCRQQPRRYPQMEKPGLSGLSLQVNVTSMRTARSSTAICDLRPKGAIPSTIRLSYRRRRRRSAEAERYHGVKVIRLQTRYTSGFKPGRAGLVSFNLPLPVSWRLRGRGWTPRLPWVSRQKACGYRHVSGRRTPPRACHIPQLRRNTSP